MTQQSRPVVFLGVGLVLAILAGLVVFALAREVQSAAPPDPYKDTTPIVVAKVDIPERTVLTGEMVEVKPYPIPLVPAKALTSVELAVRQTALVKIPAGTPIVAGQLITGGGATGLSLTIERGKVFVAFPVSDPLTSAGQIRPGDRVDILATIQPGSFTGTGVVPAPSPAATPAATPAAATAASPPPAPVTQTVVQNLEVIDIIGKNTLTFVVDHQTALVLKNLRDSGHVIDIVIRSRNETDSVRTTPVDSPYIVRTFGFRQ